MVNAAVRGKRVVLAAALYPITSAPLLADGVFTVSHDALLETVQGHPSGAETVSWPLPPTESAGALLEARLMVHAAPAWVTVNAWPAMVRTPVRLLWVLVGETATLTVPAPMPLAAEVTFSQLASVVAVHAQLESTVTDVLVAPPAAGAENAPALKVAVQLVYWN